MEMDLSWARIVVGCQKHAFLVDEIPRLLQVHCPGLQQTMPSFSKGNKQRVIRTIANCLASLEQFDAKVRLMGHLGDESQRAWRCTFEGIKTIYRTVVRGITEADCDRWARQLSGDITLLFTKPKVVAHYAISGDSGTGKTTSYQLAYHMVVHGYFQVPGTHSNGNLRDLLNSGMFSVNSATWTKDCKNVPFNRKGSYGHVSRCFFLLL
jgi:hypothetical protein